MNIIEQLGGYEKAKAKRDDINHTLENCEFLGGGDAREGLYERLESVEQALLKYRRQHNIFEKGDWVFYEITGCVGDFVDHIKLDLGHPYCMVDFGLCDVGLIMLKNIRHATDAEIKAGKRL